MSTSTTQQGTARVAHTAENLVVVDIPGVCLNVHHGYAFGYGDALAVLAAHGWQPAGPVVIPARGYTIPVTRELPA